MSQKSGGVGKTIALLLVLAGIFIGAFLFQHIDFKHKINPDQFHGAYLEQPKQIQDFSFTGIDNGAFNKTYLQGHWTLVFFGFTNCPNICPTTMAELSKMYRMLEKKGVDKKPQVVFVSVDPLRDSLEKLEHYVHAFHKDFYAARGEEGQVQAMAHELGVAFAKTPQGSDAQNYDIQHGGAVLLFNPQGELNAILTPPHKAPALVTDYLMVIS